MAIPFVDLSVMNRDAAAQIDAAWRTVLNRSFFVLGPEVENFQKLFAAYCECGHAVGVGNGLEAITLILEALGIGPGDEVIVPANTFIATWLAVSRVGATPVPVDCDLATGGILPGSVKHAVTSRTKAVIPVHLYGRPVELAELTEVAQAAGIHIIEDAAQAHGARYNGRRIGSFSTAAAFSFYPTKNLGALGDGGGITTDDQRLAERIRRLSNYGATTKYHHEIMGGNSRLDEIQAAVLSAKLPFLDKWNAERRRLARLYGDALASAPSLTLPPEANHLESVHHLFIIRSKHRDYLASRLAERGIQTAVHYPTPPHLQPAYANLGKRKGDYPNAEQIAREVLSLPIWPGLDDAAVLYVAKSVNEALSEVAAS